MTGKPDTEARTGEGGAAPEEPRPGQSELTDGKSLADGDIQTSPGIGPSGGSPAEAQAPDETARTTPFVRAVGSGAVEAGQGGEQAGVVATAAVSVDLDGGWTLSTDQTEPHTPVIAPPEPAPAAATEPEPAKGEPTATEPAAASEPAKAEPVAASEPAKAESAKAEPAGTAPAEAKVSSQAPAAVPAEPSNAAAASAEPKAAEPVPVAAAAPDKPAAAPGRDAAPATAQPSEQPAAPPPPTAAADVADATPAVPTVRAGKPIEVCVFGRTDVGLVREHNEDNFLIADLSTGNRSLLPEVRQHVVGSRGSLFVVCDGMGGAAAGEVASLLAVDTIYERLQESATPQTGIDLARTMVEAIEEAGRRIFAAARLDRTRRGMGTTVTGACLLDGTLYLAQVGDSRAYIVRGERIELVTRDQSLVNQLIEAGQLTEEEAEAFEHSNIILQALGTAAEVSVDVTHVPLRRGDILIVCSDGLSGAVSSEQMKDVVLTTPEPIDACKKLTEMANAAGGHDNITVIVSRFENEGLSPPQPEDIVVFRRVSLPPGPRSSLATPLPEPQSSPSYRQTQPDIDIPATESDDHEAEPGRGGGLTVFLLLLALWVGAAVAYVLFSGMLTANAPAGGSPVPSAVAAQLNAPAAPLGNVTMPIVSRALAAVRFRSETADAHLHVDGVDRGAFEAGSLQLTLEVGEHDVSVVVNGTALESKRLTVREGTDNDFALGTLGAAAGDAPASLAPVAPVPAGVAPPEPDPGAGAGVGVDPSRSVRRPVARPPEEPGKSPQRLVPPRSPGTELPGQQF